MKRVSLLLVVLLMIPFGGAVVAQDHPCGDIEHINNYHSGWNVISKFPFQLLSE